MIEDIDVNNDSNFSKISPESLNEDFTDATSIMDKQERDNSNAFKNEFIDTNSPLAEEEAFQKTSALDDNEEEEEEEEGTATAKKEGEGEEEDSLTIEELNESITKDEQDELERINKSLNTEYKSMNDLKDALAKKDNDKVNQEIDNKRNLHDYFNTVLKMTDRDIVFEDKRISAEQKGLDVREDSVMQDIQDEIDGMTTNELEYGARVIRSEVKSINEKNKTEIDAYDNEKSTAQQNKIAQKQENLNKAIHELYNKEDFYGLKLEKESFVNAYKSVNKSKLVNLINDNPKVALEMQLLFDNRENLAQVNGSASYSDGIRDALDRIEGKAPKKVQKVVRDKKGTAGMSDFIANFIK